MSCARSRNMTTFYASIWDQFADKSSRRDMRMLYTTCRHKNLKFNTYYLYHRYGLHFNLQDLHFQEALQHSHVRPCLAAYEPNSASISSFLPHIYLLHNKIDAETSSMDPTSFLPRQARQRNRHQGWCLHTPHNNPKAWQLQYEAHSCRNPSVFSRELRMHMFDWLGKILCLLWHTLGRVSKKK